VKRKIIIAMVAAIVAVVSTIAVRADLYSNRANRSATNLTPRRGLSDQQAVSSVLFSYFGMHEEGTYLILEGAVFLSLGLLWLKKARRDQFASEVRSSGGTD
jgi:hypothetical protein